jgi:hypothetical protein
LFEAEEPEDGKINIGAAEPAFVGADRVAELDAVAAIDLDIRLSSSLD